MKRVIVTAICIGLFTLTACTSKEIRNSSENISSAQSEENQSHSQNNNETIENFSKEINNDENENSVINLKQPKIEQISPYTISDIPQKHNLYKYSNNKAYTVKEGNNFVLYEDNEIIDEYKFNLGYAPDLVIQDFYFSLVGLLDENGVMNMELLVYDLKNKSSKSVYSEPLTNYRSYLYQLNESEVVFSYNGIDNNERCEYVVIYNFINDKCRTVLKHNEYDWGDLKTTSQEITAICANENKIYLAKEQRIEDKMHYFVTCLDENGDIVYEDEIVFLQNYTIKESNIDYIDVFGDYIFFDYYSPTHIQPTFKIGKKTNNTYTEISLNTNIYISKKVSSTLINNQYLVFSTQPDDLNYNSIKYSADLLVFDIQQGSYRLLKYNIEGIDDSVECNTLVDENGNLII